MNVSNYALNYALVIHYTKEKFFVLATGPNNLPTYVQFFCCFIQNFFPVQSVLSGDDAEVENLF